MKPISDNLLVLFQFAWLHLEEKNFIALDSNIWFCIFDTNDCILYFWYKWLYLVFLVQMIASCIFDTNDCILYFDPFYWYFLSTCLFISLSNLYISLKSSVFTTTTCALKSVASCTIGAAFVCWFRGFPPKRSLPIRTFTSRAKVS